MSDHKDILLPELHKDMGALHPINHMKDSIMDLLTSFGFETIDGPEIETEQFNFDITEINITSPTGIKQIEEKNKRISNDIASQFINIIKSHY